MGVLEKGDVEEEKGREEYIYRWSGFIDERSGAKMSMWASHCGAKEEHG